MKKKYSYYILAVAIVFVGVASVGLAQTWTGPTQDPPNGNTEPPINVSATTQTKQGGIIASLFSAAQKIELLHFGFLDLGFGPASFVKEPSAGRIHYNDETNPKALDVFGAGTATGTRSVRIFDDLIGGVPGSRICNAAGACSTFTDVINSSTSTPSTNFWATTINNNRTDIRNTNEGNVGINTATPMGILEVRQQPIAVPNPSSGFRIVNGAGSARMSLFIDTAGRSNIWSEPTIPLILNPNTGTGAGTGNVGIGLISPRSKLDVAGQICGLNAAGTARVCLETNGPGGGVDGSGILNYVPKFTPDGTTLGNSQIFDNGTNIGIGTVSPATKLHVVGNGGEVLRLSRSGITQYFSVNGPGNTGYPITFTVNGNQEVMRFPTQNTTYGAGNVIIAGGGGNVGIGNPFVTNPANLPQSKLDVAGQVCGLDASNNRVCLGAGGTGGSLPIGTTGQTLRHDGANWLANSNLFNNGTNVRVGTSIVNPLFKLHVIGDIFATTNLTINGTSWLNGNVSVGTGVAPAAKLHIGNPNDTAPAQGPVGEGTIIPQLIVRNTIIDGDINTGPFRQAIFAETADPAWAVFAYGKGGYGLRGTGSNIGVWSDGPIRISGGNPGPDKVLVSTNNLGDAQWVATSTLFNGGPGSSYWAPNGTNGINNTNTGNVGIGTTTPAEKLDVSGNIIIENSRQYRSYDSLKNKVFLAQIRSDDIMVFGDSSFRGDVWIKSGLNQSINFSPGQSLLPKVTIDSNGNIGIGTTLPAAQLHTTGTVRLAGLPQGTATSTDKFLASDANGNLKLSSISDIDSGGLPTGTSYQTLRHDGTKWVANSNLTDNGGQVFVGINNAMPARVKLRVNATGQTVGLSVSGSDTGVFGTGSNIGIHANNNNVSGKALSIQQENSSGYSIYAQGGKNYFEGNVGIGTVNPPSTVKLNVSGNSVAIRGVGITGVAGIGSSVGIDAFSDDSSGKALRARGNSGAWSIYSELGPNYFEGNVGIGVTVPTAKLHVNGASRFHGGVFLESLLQGDATKNRVIVSDDTGILNWRPEGTGKVCMYKEDRGVTWVSLKVPMAWSAETCRQFAEAASSETIGNEFYQLGCLAENSFSPVSRLGTDTDESTTVPSPNCGW